MKLAQWLKPPRRTLAVFLALTFALAASLGWLSWQLVLQDRQLEGERTRERLSHALDLVHVSLRSWLAGIDRQLESVLAVEPVSDSPADGGRRVPGDVEANSTIVVFNRESVDAYPAQRLAFFPDSFLTTDSDVARRLLVQAAELRRSGRTEAALAVYARLLHASGPALNGAPAELVARHARCDGFETLGQSTELQREARELAAAMQERPWRLTAGLYRFYAAEVHRWLRATADPIDVVPGDEARVGRAEIVSALWSEWQASGMTSTPASRGASTDNGFVIVLRKRNDRMAAFIADPAELEHRVRSSIVADADRIGIELCLIDQRGRPAFGQLPSAPAERVMRTATEGGLPWTIYASAGSDWTGHSDARARSRLIMASASLVGACVLVAGYFTARAMHRELEIGRLQTEFVAAVSHEFRTPLAAFGQITELLVDGRVASDADRVEYYRRLQRESGRLCRLVEDLLDFRRMEAGAREYSLEPIDLSVLVRDVVEDFRPDAAERGVSVDLQVAPGLAPVRADRAALGRALWNLLDNAVKYSPGSHMVWVAASCAADGAQIAVRDAGIGIAMDRQQAVFERFVRVQSAETRAVPGTGLGLAMVRHIVRAHRGDVHLESAPGMGSTFTMTLPWV
jgi:signal transduction histidine kinase